MCTGTFELSPLGLNRKVPDGFFDDMQEPGANFSIGTASGIGGIDKLATPHSPSEVIPDAYNLSIQFTSCLTNNLNTSVFQYYVKMTGSDSEEF